ncbi:hypothetical protein A3A09_02770 [Candidatus Nomurabacteria bacterium RIFCSPLOWO2_01_FULL_42_20]|uniref:Uncharacterized protein n=1 Tax=Candidatus Nomurabacteria bacterium RIFCSPHIGHO2_01_FULL_42_16 TaxID=1801743 RepID=A0A1F6VHB2_9BACT|nr:MAG: hypothetical protein A2824_02515 [Candidatus Nomurabacteria bacterium RIFCSPHIGHO2_01_FULL_42_16]OGI91178.1 MAG: hypothetical protein A3A09_02770 [Candidatus Nomurabacteria bacterium RIFCSPLOWO2_01_FULL_42_20]
MFIKVKVEAGAKREEIKKISDDRFEIRVKEKARANAANYRVLQLIALHFRLPFNKVRLISGHQKPNKILEILIS